LASGKAPIPHLCPLLSPQVGVAAGERVVAASVAGRAKRPPPVLLSAARWSLPRSPGWAIDPASTRRFARPGWPPAWTARRGQCVRTWVSEFQWYHAAPSVCARMWVTEFRWYHAARSVCARMWVSEFGWYQTCDFSAKTRSAHARVASRAY
jgi:hypothetical protein